MRADVVARKIPPEELRGYTITLSNFGMIGAKYAAPIVMPPTVAILGADGDLVGAPERDVAGRVLVEERIQEDRVQLPDAPLAVDERELPEPRRSLVDRRAPAQRRAARSRRARPPSWR